jgi:hypothetical protein
VTQHAPVAPAARRHDDARRDDAAGLRADADAAQKLLVAHGGFNPVRNFAAAIDEFLHHVHILTAFRALPEDDQLVFGREPDLGDGLGGAPASASQLEFSEPHVSLIGSYRMRRRRSIVPVGAVMYRARTRMNEANFWPVSDAAPQAVSAAARCYSEVVTKVQIRFRLQRPLDEVLLARISDAHALYGIHRVKVAPTMDSLTVEYDATRLRPAEVGSALAGAGIAVEPA